MQHAQGKSIKQKLYINNVAQNINAGVIVLRKNVLQMRLLEHYGNGWKGSLLMLYQLNCQYKALPRSQKNPKVTDGVMFLFQGACNRHYLLQG